MFAAAKGPFDADLVLVVGKRQGLGQPGGVRDIDEQIVRALNTHHGQHRAAIILG
jgi:hypothetical protein